MIRALIVSTLLSLLSLSAHAQHCGAVGSGEVCQALTPQANLTIRPTQGAAFYGDSTPAKSSISWWIGQWGIPTPFGPFQADPNTPTIITAEASRAGEVQIILGANPYYELSQQGTDLPCFNFSTGVGEYDLFANSMGSEGVPQGYSLGMPVNWAAGKPATLANITSATATYTVGTHFLRESASNNGFCSQHGSIDQYSVLYSVILSNPSAGQTVFYQVILASGDVEQGKFVPTTSV